jgi:hypothetical protein
MSNSRDISQFSAFLTVDDSTKNIGIATTATPYVGIGTTNPTSKLHVVGNVLIVGVSTLGVTSTTNLTSQQLNVSGISTLGVVTSGNIYSTGVVTATTFSGTLSGFASSAGVSTYATNAGISTYATNAGIATYATNAGIATYATNAGIATYATNAGVSTYATSAGIATYATNAGVSTSVIGGIASVTQLIVSSGITTLGVVTSGNIYSTGVITATSFSGNASSATYATNAGVSTYATSAGIATYATNAGVSTYATSAGIATYATNAGVSTYATNAGIATYATNAGISTYATNAGIATYATNAGVSTYATNAGIATYATNAGISTYATNAGIATYATNAGIATYATSAGIATYATNAGIATNVIGGIASVTQLNVSGISTLGVTSATNLTTQQLNVSGLSTFSGIATYTTSLFGTTASFTGVVTASSFSGNTSSATYATNAGIATYATNAGIATYATNAGFATALQNSRTFEITGDIVASAISFNGTGNVSLAATIQPNSVALGSDTTGDYVQSISGTSNQINVSVTSGEGSTPTLSIPNQFTIPQDATVLRDLQVDRNLNVNGNITIGGTSAAIFAQELKISDPDIVLGFRTDAFGNDISNDTTANHGGVALASTEGTPLVNLFIAGIETNPSTYKKIMWFKEGTFAGLGTDAWLFNYAVGIGSTQFPSGTRLAAGSVQFTENDLAVVRNINAPSGIITASSFVGDLNGNAATATYATNAGIATYATNAGIATYATSAGIATYATNAGIATYATNAGIATYATSAGIATYATNAGVSTYATNAGIATYATSAGIATYATNAGIATYATNAGIATYATNAGIATYATSAGIATYATNAGIATYATNAGIATYATNAGIATYATSAGIATYATNAGIATYATNAGIATYATSAGIATYATNAGIATYATSAGIATYATSAGIATYATNAGIATYATNAGVSTYATSSGIATYATNAGIATYATSAGIATYATNAGLSTYATSSGIATYATSAGIATYATNAGIATYATNAGIATYATNAGIATYATNAGIATNLKGGVIGNIAYQSAADTTVFLTNGGSGTILQSNGVGNAPTWVAAAPSNAISGLTVRDEGAIVGGANSISQFNFVGAIVSVASTAGIATITFLDYVSNAGMASALTSTASVNTTGILTATRLSTGASGTGINVDTNTISGPSILYIDPSAVGDNTGAVRIKGDLYVDGTQFVVNSSTIELADLRVGIATTVGTSLLLDGGGIGIGSANIIKTITWNNTAQALTSSEDWNLASGKQYEINNTSVLTSTTLGSGVVNSSLTSVGTLGQLIVTGVTTSGGFNATTGNDYKINGTSVLNATTLGSVVVNSSLTSVGTLGQLQITGISTFTNGPVLVGTATSTGTESQTLQVTGGAYVSGRIGVGTTNPTYGVHIQGTSIAEIGFTATGAGGDNFRVGSGSIAAGFDGLRVYDVNASAERLRVDSSGNIVINSTAATGTASQPLQVTGGAYVSGNLGIGNTNPGAKLDVTGDIKLSAADAEIEFNTGGARLKGRSNALSIHTGGGLDSEASEQVRINTTGVGIGTTNPTQTLHVQGSARVTGGIYDSNNNVGTAGSVLSSTGSGLSWIAASGGGGGISSVSISTNTTNQSQYLTYVTGTGTTTGFGITTTGLVFNPSTTRLGIGTTNPGATLNVVPTATSIAGLFSGTTSSDMVRITQLGTGNALVVEDSTNPDATPFTIRGDGSVGIGTNNPTVALQLSPTASISNVGSGITLAGTVGSALTVAQFYYSNTNASYLRIEATRNTTGSDWLSASTKLVNVTDVTGQAYIEFNPNGSQYGMAFGSGATEWARFLQAGNLGIGITNPGSKLQVVGNAAGVRLTDNTASVGDLSSSGWILYQRASNASQSSSGFSIQKDSNSSALTINSSNNIGIGSDNPTSKLHIEGGNVFVGAGNTVLLGYNTPRFNFSNTTNTSAALQLEGTGAQRRLSIISDESSSTGPSLILAHQRSGSVGGNTILQSGDDVGALLFQGSDGSEFVNGATIQCSVDGTPAANVMPTAMAFFLNPGAAGVVERMRITGIGSVGIGITNPGAKLDVAGDIRLSAIDAEIEFNTGGARLKGRSNALSIHTGGGLDSEASEQVRINTTGVGIGTTNPIGQLQVSIGPVIIGAATSTGTASQRLQVTGGAYVSDNLGVGVTAPAFKADIAGDARVTSTNKMRFGGTAGTTNFYIQYNSTTNSLDFVAG